MSDESDSDFEAPSDAPIEEEDARIDREELATSAHTPDKKEPSAPSSSAKKEQSVPKPQKVFRAYGSKEMRDVVQQGAQALGIADEVDDLGGLRAIAPAVAQPAKLTGAQLLPF